MELYYVRVTSIRDFCFKRILRQREKTSTENFFISLSVNKARTLSIAYVRYMLTCRAIFLVLDAVSSISRCDGKKIDRKDANK